MTPLTIHGYQAARDKLEELEAEYLAANPDDVTAGYYMNPLEVTNMLGGEWELVFSHTKYADILNARARRLLLKEAGIDLETERFGPYRGGRSNDVVGI